MGDRENEYAFVLVANEAKLLYPVLAKIFTHPWVASYQVGFGPPLVRSSERLIRRVKIARSALEKLEAYVEHCLLDEETRARLIGVFRRLMVRRDGGMEAEALDQLSASVLDLVVRLNHPADAPPAVTAAMAAEGIDPAALPAGEGPELMTGRFLVKLADPRNARLLHADAVAEAASDPESALAVELRVPVRARQVFDVFLRVVARDGLFKVVALGEPLAHARTRTDGHKA